MDAQGFLAVALLVLTFGMLSGRLERSIITAPMFFAAAGLVLSRFDVMSFDG